LIVAVVSSCKSGLDEEKIREARYDEIRIGGELKERIHRNYDRMEGSKFDVSGSQQPICNTNII
jgi:hypothetical protein